MSDLITIGFDAKRIVSNSTGLGSYGRTLVNDLADLDLRLRLYAPDKGRDDLRTQIKETKNISFCYPAPSKLPFNKALWRSRGIIKDLKRDGIQVFHGLSGELPIGISQSGMKSVVTIHDLIFLRHPEFYHWIDTKIYGWKFRQTIREADHIIAISECTKRDIIELSQERYILTVGSIEARKNILLAVKALPNLSDDISLVIVGRHTPYTELVKDYAKKNKLEGRIKIMHNVKDISCGLPVVACIGSCLEEAGGPDCLYVDPDDVEGMAAALRQVLKGAEGREERIRRSRDYIRRFEGLDIAKQVAEIYSRLL